jgi:hypothetical protein
VIEYAFDRDAVAEAIFPEVEWIDDSPAALDALPETWVAIASEQTSAERIRRSLGLWDREFVAALPRFGSLLEALLVDVVPARLDGGQVVLLYVTTDGAEFATWVGTDPRLFGEEPRTWGKLPPPLRRFLRDTHPSLGVNDWDTCGLTHPSRQVSLYERGGLAEVGVPASDTQVGEYDDAPIDLSELFQLSWDGEQHTYVTSPRFAPGELAVKYESDFEMVDLWPSLDDMFCMAYQNEVF